SKGAQRVYLIATPTDTDFLNRAHEELLELARRDAESKGQPEPVKEDDYRDAHFYRVGENEAHAIVEGKLVIASGVDALKTLIDRIRDANDSPLTDDPTWKARRESLGDQTSAWALANLARLREFDPERFVPEQTDPGALF